MRTEKSIRGHIETVRKQKVIAAAKLFFKLKAYVSHEIRDIRKESSGKEWLVNYYFHSKQKVMEKVIVQNTLLLFNTLAPVLNDSEKTVIQKIEYIVLVYIDLLLEKPDYAIYILNELLSQSTKIDIIAIKREYLLNSHFMMQVLELKKKRNNNFNPIQMILNLIGMVLLPLASVDSYAKSASKENRQFTVLIEQRKKMLPLWTSAIVQ
jgi:hypothetical protein